MTTKLVQAPQRQGRFDTRWYLVPLLYAAISLGAVLMTAHELPRLDASSAAEPFAAPATAPMLWIV